MDLQCAGLTNTASWIISYRINISILQKRGCGSGYKILGVIKFIHFPEASACKNLQKAQLRCQLNATCKDGVPSSKMQYTLYISPRKIGILSCLSFCAGAPLCTVECLEAYLAIPMSVAMSKMSPDTATCPSRKQITLSREPQLQINNCSMSLTIKHCQSQGQNQGFCAISCAWNSRICMFRSCQRKNVSTRGHRKNLHYISSYCCHLGTSGFSCHKK